MEMQSSLDSQHLRDLPMLNRADSPVLVFQRTSLVLAAIVAMVGALELAAWVLHPQYFASVLPGVATMKFNTAFCFVVFGCSLFGLQAVAARHSRRSAAIAGLVIALTIAMLTLIEYLFGLNLGIDELILPDPATGLQNGAPGRMSGTSAICLLLLGAALLLQQVKADFWQLSAQLLVLPAMVLALIGLEGYLFNTSAVAPGFLSAFPALSTTILFLLLSIAVLCAQPQQGFMATISSNGIGGALVRRGLLWIVVVPVFIAWLSVQGKKAGFYDTDIGLALFATSSIIIFTGVIWFAARSLNRLHTALEQRNLINARMAAIVESSDDAIIGKDLSGIITSWNQGAEQTFGYSAAEMIGQSVTRLIPSDRQHEEAQILARVMQGKHTDHFETLRLHKHGRLIDVSITVSPIRNEFGVIIGASKVARDVGEQKLMEHRFRLVVEAAPSAMLMIDRKRTITLVNRKTEELFGYEREELLGQPVEMLVPERFRDRHPGHVAGFFAAPGTRSMGAGRELFGRRKDGSEVPIEIGLNPIETADGLFTLASIIDITERKLMDERFRISVESAPTAMIMVDAAGLITMVNALTETMFGSPRAELLGQPVEILLPPRYRVRHPGLRHGFFRAPSARSMGEGRDLYGQHKDGTEFQVEIGLNPIETSEGMFVLAAIADITERKRSEQELHRKTEALTRSNQELEQFAYIASHDLQEPLRAVAGCVQLLQRRYQGQLDARADEFIGHAVDGAARMQNLIDDLLAYSRVGRIEDPLVPAACEKALALALKNLATAMAESGVSISSDELPIVHGITAQLALLFQNLVGNAIKFRNPDKSAVVHVGVVRHGNEWQFSIEDNGIGIDPLYFERIFAIFQRLHTRREYPGTGIGLALCKRIVERHGGRIWVESVPGQGTVFRFVLPAVDTVPQQHEQ